MDDIALTAFFGDAQHRFTLTDDMIAELERITGMGIGAVFNQFVAGQFRIQHLAETIRLGLIGGGMAPETAKALCDAYARNRPLAELLPLSLSILEARWNGAGEVAA